MICERNCFCNCDGSCAMNHPPITDAAITAASMSLKPSIRPYEIQLCLNRLVETNSGSAHILERYIHQLESMLIGNAEQDENGSV